MANAQSRLQIIIDVITGKGSGQVNNLIKQMGSLDQSVASYKKQLDGATPQNLKFASQFAAIQDSVENGTMSIDAAKKAVGQLEKEMKASRPQEFSNSWAEVGKQFAIVAAGLAAFGVAAKKVYEFGKAGAQLEMVENRFNRLAESIGTTGDALLNDLEPAMGGMLSEAEMMGAATDLMALGLVKSHDEAIRLSRVAGQLNMNMNQLVLTLTNRTTMRFDALGVSVDGFDEKVKALEATGLSTQEAFSEAFLQQAEEQLERVGSVVDEDIALYARLEVQLKNSTDEMKKQLSDGLVPLIKSYLELAEAQDLLLDESDEVDQAFQKGILSARDYELATGRAAHGGVVPVTEATKEATNALERYEEMNRRAEMEISALTEASIAEASAIDDVADSTISASDAMNKFSLEMVFAKASANLTEEAALQLGYSLGLVDEKTVFLLETLPKLVDEFDTNRDGMIDAGEAAMGYTDAVNALYSGLERLDGKTVRTTVITSFIEEGTPYGERSSSSRVGGELGDFAGGADFVVPPGYPHDSASINVSSGERVQVTPRNQVTNNWNIYTNGGQQPYQRDYNLQRALAR